MCGNFEWQLTMMAKVIIPNTADWFKNAKLKDGLYQFSDGMTLLKVFRYMDCNCKTMRYIFVKVFDYGYQPYFCTKYDLCQKL